MHTFLPLCPHRSVVEGPSFQIAFGIFSEPFGMVKGNCRKYSTIPVFFFKHIIQKCILYMLVNSSGRYLVNDNRLLVRIESVTDEGAGLDLFLDYLLENENDPCMICGIKSV